MPPIRGRALVARIAARYAAVAGLAAATLVALAAGLACGATPGRWVEPRRRPPAAAAGPAWR